ncbi:MAG: GNAT family N-acetyltransferase [Spirochaetales bacterium]|nr:GNAT family N-acetyltransferase [Spirochaetales bacterium]
MITINKKDLTIITAKEQDIHSVFYVLKNAAEWLEGEGINYCQDWHDPSEEFKKRIKNSLNNNEFYLVKYENKVIGCFRLQSEDKLLWGERNDEAGYVHYLTRLSTLHAKNVGKSILEWIEEYCRKKNKNYVRLNCGMNSLVLRGYYELLGFNNVGTVVVDNEELSLYEKEL